LGEEQSFMIITRQIKETVSLMFSPAPPEQGGILGMKNGVISAFVLDNSEQKTESAEYSPNTQFLNRQIEKWADEGIEFCGILHSHPSGQTTLSGSDMEYIKELYHVNLWLEKTYFPLIIDGCDMIVYAVEKSNGKIEVKRTQPEIID
jgi:proteasome lid subunit RPN8/RPN11